VEHNLEAMMAMKAAARVEHAPKPEALSVEHMPLFPGGRHARAAAWATVLVNVIAFTAFGLVMIRHLIYRGW
jgi:hypothetical protein